MPGKAVMLHALNSCLSPYEVVRGSGVVQRSARLPQGVSAAAWYAVGPWHEHGQPEGEPTPDDVLLARFGASLLDRAHETVLPLLSQPAGRGAGAGLATALRELRERVHAQLDSLGVTLDTDGPADVIVTRPGAESTSFNYRERRYMGLHVDQHDGLPLGRRGQARRLCLVNIGWLHRYVYVYPYRVLDLCHAIGITMGGSSHDRPSREVTAGYFAAYPDASILRIRIEPGSGYLLNAQDLVHDGAAPQGNAPAVAFHSMGTLRSRTEATNRESLDD